jgi:2-methylcitrate dehydratase PrpD
MEPLRQLADWVADFKGTSVPSDIVEYGKMLILDQIGCQVAGRQFEWSRAVEKATALSFTGKDLSTLGLKRRVDVLPPAALAFVNSALGHAFEADDTHTSASIHPGSIIIPAVMAVGRGNPQLHGRDLLSATIAGYETLLAIARVVTPNLTDRGFHPPLAVGPYGAAAACARVLNLERDKVWHALGVAGSYSGGLTAYIDHGGEVKRIHSAIAAEAGVRSVHLAQAGFRGPDETLAGRRGFWSTFGGLVDSRPGLFELPGDSGFQLSNTAIKPYCSHIRTFSAIDATANLVARLRLDGPRGVHTRVSSVRVYVSRSTMRFLNQGKNIRDILSAQLSVNFAVALRLVKGSNSLDDYLSTGIANREVADLMQRIHVQENPALGAEYPDKYSATVEIELFDGQTHSQTVRYPRGFAENRLTVAEAVDKFNEMTCDAIGPIKASAIKNMVLNLEKYDRLEGLYDLLK